MTLLKTFRPFVHVHGLNIFHRRSSTWSIRVGDSDLIPYNLNTKNSFVMTKRKYMFYTFMNTKMI